MGRRCWKCVKLQRTDLIRFSEFTKTESACHINYHQPEVVCSWVWQWYHILSEFCVVLSQYLWVTCNNFFSSHSLPFIHSFIAIITHSLLVIRLNEGQLFLPEQICSSVSVLPLMSPKRTCTQSECVHQFEAKANSLPLITSIVKDKMCVMLERFVISGSNSLPHIGKVQILHPWVWITVKYLWVAQVGGRGGPPWNWWVHNISWKDLQLYNTQLISIKQLN